MERRGLEKMATAHHDDRPRPAEEGDTAVAERPAASSKRERRSADSLPAQVATAAVAGVVAVVSRTHKRDGEPEAAIVAPAHVLSERFADPDLVDRIFEYIVQQIPEIAGRHVEIKRQIRDEFASERVYVRRRGISDVHPLAAAVAKLFNGRNASEVARELQISRATVYRLLKQPGRV